MDFRSSSWEKKSSNVTKDGIGTKPLNEEEKNALTKKMWVQKRP